MPGTFPDDGEVLFSRVCGTIGNQLGENTFSWICGGKTGGGASLLEIAAGLDASYVAQYKALMSSEATYAGTGVKNMTAPKTMEYADVSNAGVGTVVQAALPTQLSYLIKKTTILGSRGNHGRIYPFFAPVTAVGPSGIMTSSFYTTLQALAAAIPLNLLITGAAGTITVVMLLRHGKTSFTYTPVSGLVASPLWATQRRRGEFGAPNTPPFA